LNARAIVGWILLVLLLVFVGYNLEPARVRFVGMKLEMPVAFIVLVSAGIGAALAWAFGVLRGGGKSS